MVKKKVKDFVTNGITLGTGSLVIGRLGGATAHHAQAGLTNMSRFMPVMGTAMGAGMTLQAVKKLPKAKKKKWL